MAKQKLIKCKTCGEMMAKSAKRCPHCGAKQKLPVGVSLLITIIIIVTVFAVVAVLMNGTGTQSGTQGAENTQEAAEQDNGQLILDQDGIQIYFNGFSEPPYPAKGYYIDLHIENNSSTDYMIQIDNLSVDGYMVPFGNYIFSPEVLAGKKLNDHIWVTGTDELGIELPIKSAEFNFKLNAGNNLNNPFVATDKVTVK